MLARALQGYALPPEAALEPARAFFRDSDHQLMSTTFVGEVHPAKEDAFDVFTTRATVKAEEVAQPAGGEVCQLKFPS